MNARNLKIGLVLFGAALAFFFYYYRQPRFIAGEKAPDFAAVLADGKTVRFADRYLRSRGSAEQPEFTSAPPAVPLHLYVLFIARFSDYLTGAKHLSSVIRFFQGRPVLTPPNLPEIVAELHTPSFTVQNEIWSTLKAPQHPAVMYKITMLLLESEATTGGKVIQEVHTTLIQN